MTLNGRKSKKKRVSILVHTGNGQLWFALPLWFVTCVVTGFALLTPGLLIMLIRLLMAMKLSCGQLTVLVTLNGVINRCNIWSAFGSVIWSKFGRFGLAVKPMHANALVWRFYFWFGIWFIWFG
jgi:hypothetical protein